MALRPISKKKNERLMQNLHLIIHNFIQLQKIDATLMITENSDHSLFLKTLQDSVDFF